MQLCALRRDENVYIVLQLPGLTFDMCVDMSVHTYTSVWSLLMLLMSIYVNPHNLV